MSVASRLARPALMALAAGIATISPPHTTLLESKPTDRPLTYSERLVGNYENRLRRFSSPERVFEYFSSVEMDKQFFMTRDDLARALTPFTYQPGAVLTSKNAKYNLKAAVSKPSKEVVDEYMQLVQKLLHGDQEKEDEDVEQRIAKLLEFREQHRIEFETHARVLRALNLTNAEFDRFLAAHGVPERKPTFFDLVDADGDGLLSYAEYMFFNTLLAIPERQFELAFKMFDTDDNGRLDQYEFKQIMEMMRLRTPAGRQDRSLQNDEMPIFQHLFGEHGTKTLSFEDFRAFRRKLKAEIMRIQFEQYNLNGTKQLSPRDFGMFLVSFLNQRDIKKWIERVELLRDMEGSISEQDFMNFAVFLDRLDELQVAIDLIMQKQGLNKDQFQRAARAALHDQDGSITQLQIDILFALFDADGDGYLSPAEFIDVMRKRKDAGRNERRDIGAIDWMVRLKACLEKNL